MPTDEQARLTQVEAGIATGETLAAIGRRIGLTRERVRQILAKYNQTAAWREARRIAREDLTIRRLADWWTSTEGRMVGDIESHLAAAGMAVVVVPPCGKHPLRMTCNGRPVRISHPWRPHPTAAGGPSYYRTVIGSVPEAVYVVVLPTACYVYVAPPRRWVVHRANPVKPGYEAVSQARRKYWPDLSWATEAR